MTSASVSPIPPEATFEPVETPNLSQRFDRDPVKLETRGVTSQPKPPRQTLLFARELIWKESIVAKLDEIHRNELADKIRDCHTLKSVRQCQGCKSHSVFWNRCENLWCPCCASRLSRERKQAVEWWTKSVKQPKHVVLTVRNTETITREHVLQFKAAFAKLRRRQFARNWAGGFYSLETTNESRGWHLHLHALVDARWIDARELSQQWADCVGQLFAIVKVKDARDQDYLNEVTKYAVKGSDLSGWSAQDIADFVDAFAGVRTFGVFGSLYAKRTQWREWIEQLHHLRTQCECGCNSWRIMSENEFDWQEAVEPNVSPIPPPRKIAPAPQLEFAIPLPWNLVAD